MIEEPTHEFIAYAPCGCVVGLMTDMRDPRDAKELGTWLQAGLRVVRVLRSSQEFVEAVHNFGHKCREQQLSLLEEKGK